MYYVYVGRVEGAIVYVGKGLYDRDSHLNSGCSHVYEANRLHFSGGSIDVERVITGLTEEDALEFESLLISETLPQWNVYCGTNTYKKTNSTSEFLGVSSYPDKQDKPWRAWCKVGGIKKHIGYYGTEVEAAKARDAFLRDNGIVGKMNCPAD